MIMQMLLLGFRVREIPAVMHARTEGESMHSGLKPIIYMFRMTISIIAVWIREKILKLDKEKIKGLEMVEKMEYSSGGFKIKPEGEWYRRRTQVVS